MAIEDCVEKSKQCQGVYPGISNPAAKDLRNTSHLRATEGMDGGDGNSPIVVVTRQSVVTPPQPTHTSH
jgi:hypothetical protein